MNKYIFLFLIVVFMNSCAAGAYEDEARCNRQKAMALFTLAQPNPRSPEERIPNILIIASCPDSQKERRSYNE